MHSFLRHRLRYIGYVDWKQHIRRLWRTIARFYRVFSQNNRISFVPPLHFSEISRFWWCVGYLDLSCLRGLHIAGVTRFHWVIGHNNRKQCVCRLLSSDISRFWYVGDIDWDGSFLQMLFAAVAQLYWVISRNNRFWSLRRLSCSGVSSFLSWWC